MYYSCVSYSPLEDLVLKMYEFFSVFKEVSLAHEYVVHEDPEKEHVHFLLHCKGDVDLKKAFRYFGIPCYCTKCNCKEDFDSFIIKSNGIS